MKYTQDQLIEMSDKDAAKSIAIINNLNIVAENKFGIVIQQTKENGTFRNYFDPCNNPRDYMPIAIDNEIDIVYDEKQVRCIFSCFYGYTSAAGTRWMDSENTGRAVCEAFLMGVE